MAWPRREHGWSLKEQAVGHKKGIWKQTHMGIPRGATELPGDTGQGDRLGVETRWSVAPGDALLEDLEEHLNQDASVDSVRSQSLTLPRLGIFPCPVNCGALNYGM